MPNLTWGIVVAAGSGTRFGASKQFARLGGSCVAHLVVEAAAEACDEVVVVLPPGAAWDGPPVAAAVPGGATRSESVRAGLAVVPEDAQVIVVHDAARPLATPALFRAVIDAVRGGADAAVPGIAVTDTLKQVRDGLVVATVDRDVLVAVQTPQAFRASVLRAAHRAGRDGTDDAALVEVNGGKVVVVPGEVANLKLTRPTDLVLLEVLRVAQ